jgi:hypothetical protein
MKYVRFGLRESDSAREHGHDIKRCSAFRPSFSQRAFNVQRHRFGAKETYWSRARNLSSAPIQVRWVRIK